ncbi:MAG: hypothetical protein L0H53_16040 [Candidatus Nitrosocosmicus sp.]|nr:hypothetical protein [Candidatus Nitrosocosmicus sp.]MDN5869019.1 hypothetical protein [Candidatus Nitrosocosmicus sp.]
MRNSNDKGYEDGAAGTNKNRQIDSLKEYLDKESMSQVEVNAGEPASVKGNPDDNQITSEGHTRISIERASEEYQKKKHTKIENDS